MGAGAEEDFVFFYGTLLPEIAETEIRRVVDKLERMDGGTAAGRLYDMGPYPAFVPAAAATSSPAARVRGAVFRLPADPRVLRLLDLYEGHDPERPDRSLFVRAKERVSLDGGGEVIAWCYRYNGDPGGAAIIASGDYLSHLRRQARRASG